MIKQELQDIRLNIQTKVTESIKKRSEPSSDNNENLLVSYKFALVAQLV